MNLIFDISHSFFKSYAVFKSRYENVDLSTEDSQQQLIRKFLSDFCFSINIYERLGIENVVCCMDSQLNFRKELCDKYKANREKQEEGFYIARNQVKEILKAKGFLVSEIEKCEADDLCSAWSKHFSKLGQQSIILSSDKDIRQLADENVVVYSNNSKMAEIYYTQPMDFFWNFKSSVMLTYHEVSPDYITFEKTILGDKGDNVFMVAKRGVGRLKMMQLANICKEKNIFNNYKEVYDVCEQSGIFEGITFERFILNKNLVDLKNPGYPENIATAIKNHVEELKDSYKFEGAFSMQCLYK